jgi:predicted nuclease of restriction endonuclease-like (RecB) superfamily
MIESRLIERSGGAVTNFALTLPKPQSDLARESLKDPYRFDFLGLGEEAQEREIENALVKHVTDFLLELGAGFGFVGGQVLMDGGRDEFFLDLASCRIPAARTAEPPAEHVQIERELAGTEFPESEDEAKR